MIALAVVGLWVVFFALLGWVMISDKDDPERLEEWDQQKRGFFSGPDTW